MEEKIYVFLAIIVLVALCAGAILVSMPRTFYFGGLNANADKTIEFKIKKGDSLGGISNQLKEQKIIYSKFLFTGYTLLVGKDKKYKAGTYDISVDASIRDLANLFSSNAGARDISVVIFEGTNIGDVAKTFSDQSLINLKDFLTGDIIGQEGFLFPDTYKFRQDDFNKPSEERDGMAEKIVQKMRDNFEQKTAELFHGLTVEQIRETVIIASMIEKEVRGERDMRLVSGIIRKRIKIGKPLQLDATVSYGVCLPKFESGQYCDVSMANIVDNIHRESVYNTYRRKGLPAGPISNPGLDSLKAALNPEKSDYLYYLSARDGTTIFSKTASEHETNRRKYILGK